METDDYIEAPAESRPMFLHVGDTVAHVSLGGWRVEHWQVVSHDERTAFVYGTERVYPDGGDIGEDRPAFKFVGVATLFRPEAAASNAARLQQEWRMRRDRPALADRDARP